MKILVIESDSKKIKKMTAVLREQYIIEAAQTGEDGEYLAETGQFSLLILDINLSDKSGLKVCSNLRHQDIHTPILMISSCASTAEKIISLDSGADDFLAFPTDNLELTAHIRALLRRSQTKQFSHVIKIEDLSLDTMLKKVIRGDKGIQLRRKEFEMLEYFMRNQGKVITRQMLLNHLWESTFETYTNTVDVHVKYLRDRVDKPFGKKLIKTVYGFGYKLET